VYRLYLLPTSAGSHVVPACRLKTYVDVSLRRNPTAPLTAGICRRDSLARPSSRSGTSYFVPGVRQVSFRSHTRPRQSDDTIPCLSHVPPALSREVAADGYVLTVSFFSVRIFDLSIGLFFVVSKEILHLPQSTAGPRQNIKTLLETLLLSLSPPRADALDHLFTQNSLTVRVAITVTANVCCRPSFQVCSSRLLLCDPTVFRSAITPRELRERDLPRSHAASFCLST
jgi:hypothetical protein